MKENPSTAIATTSTTYAMTPQNFEQAIQFSKMMANSQLVPKNYQNRPEDCFIAMQWGAEIGLQPMQALQSIATINGRPSLWGDAMLALVKRSPLCEYVVEQIGDEAATCKVKRQGEPEQSRTFTVDDARRAGLWDKQGPWKQYPKRMLQMRARGYALRDVFPDLLRGLSLAEEALDVPRVRDMGMVEEVAAPAPTTPPPAPRRNPEEKPTPSFYDDDKFKRFAPRWAAAIAEGKGTVERLQADKEAAGTPLSPEQVKHMQKLVQDAMPTQDEPEDRTPAVAAPTYAQVADALTAAKNVDALNLAADRIRNVPDEGQREELDAVYDRRLAELEGEQE